MPNITGPVAMMLLEKNGVRYLMIGDRHTPYNFDGCARGLDAIMIQSYKQKILRKVGILKEVNGELQPIFDT